MGNIRTKYKGAYGLEKHETYMAIHYACMYDKWKRQYNEMDTCIKGISYDEKIGTAAGDPTFTLAERRVELSRKITIIEAAARLTSKKYYDFILKALTAENSSLDYVRLHYDMPCGKNTFYVLRRKFYYLLARMI